MSKKSKRQIRKEPGSSVAMGATQPSVIPSSSRGPVFNPDYSHILKDLRRIGILAGSFVAILIVLYLILPK